MEGRIDKFQVRPHEALSSVLEVLPHMIWCESLEGNLIYGNTQWMSFTGPTCTRSNWVSRLHPEDFQTANETITKAKSSKISSEIECRLMDSQGQWLWHLIRCLPIKDENNIVIQWLMSATNIHSQKRAVLMRDEFLRVASHEFNTPLTSLKLRLSLAKRTLGRTSMPFGETQKIHEALTDSEEHLDQLIEMVDTFLKVTRRDNKSLIGEPWPLELSEIVRECVKAKSRGFKSANCNLKVEIQSGIFGNWDRQQIRKAILQLFDNAIKFACDQEVFISLSENDGQAILKVRDTGPGLKACDLERIFECYERATDSRNVSGWGIGLYMVKQTVMAYGGKVKVTSYPGKGACFTIELPILDENRFLQGNYVQ